MCENHYGRMVIRQEETQLSIMNSDCCPSGTVLCKENSVFELSGRTGQGDFDLFTAPVRLPGQALSRRRQNGTGPLGLETLTGHGQVNALSSSKCLSPLDPQ